MSRRRRQDYAGCYIEPTKNRKLRLRWRQIGADGHPEQRSRVTGLQDNDENRRRLEPLRHVIGKVVDMGKDPLPYLIEHLPAPAVVESSDALVQTVRDYFKDWYAASVPHVRPALERDYRRHFENFILPELGDLDIAELRPRDVRMLQAKLLSQVSEKTGKPLSVKYVRNIILGSLAAMVSQAKADELLDRDPFAGLKWSRWDHPEADPLDADERDAVLKWFYEKKFGFHPGRGGTSNRLRPHPHYHAYLHFCFWHGARPSEASGLVWQHVDLKRGVVYVRKSFHMGEYGAPKTRPARRTIELHPATIELLHALQPLKVTPDMPVFTSTTGTPIEPKVLSRHWYDALRALGIRQRGLYVTKDTFVTLTLKRAEDDGRGQDVIPWLVQQTGVAYETLRKHYARWIPRTPEQSRERYAWLDPTVRRNPRTAA